VWKTNLVLAEGFKDEQGCVNANMAVLPSSERIKIAWLT
jgi:hypothetical protein